MSNPVTVWRYPEADLAPEQVREIDEIFFETSSTKSFESATARAAFRERWLGRYLEHDPEFAYLARTADGGVVGYLVGATDNPATASRFADIPYFAALGTWTKRYPAHLHVNVGSAFRNRGIGALLVARFLADARATGAPGAHVITGAGAPNVNFYNRNGFAEIARAGKDDSLLFLARTL